MSAYPSGGDPTAVLGRRSGAYIVDTLIAAGLAIGAFFATADFTEITDLTRCPNTLPSGRSCATANDFVYFFDSKAVLFAILGWLVYAVLVMWLLQAATGATVGKALFGVRTVNEAGTGPGFGRQTLRGLLWIFPDGFFSCFGIPIVAALTAGMSKGHRRVGDMAAKTYVVRSTSRGNPIVVPGAVAPATVAPGVAATAVVPPPAPTAPPYQAAPYAPSPAPTTDDATAVYPAAAAAAAPAWARETETAPSDPTVVEPAPTEPAPVEPVPAEAVPVEPAPADGPQWDPQRNAYVQYDQARQAWLVFDDAAQEWKPLT